jgi:polyvinyl alcohol dehydrogenase (cytochrome)
MGYVKLECAFNVADLPIGSARRRSYLFLALRVASVLSMVFAAFPENAVPAISAQADARQADEFTRSFDSKHQATVDREAGPGANVYHRVCAQCHEGQVPKAPSRTFVEMMAPEAIYGALTTGAMREIGAQLTEAERKSVAEYVSSQKLGAAPQPEAPRCTGRAAVFSAENMPIDRENTNYIPVEAAELPAQDIPRLKLKWALAYPGALRARSRPAFALGALFVGSQSGAVYALDAASGCIRWEFRTNVEVRTRVSVAKIGLPGRDALAFFGDLIGRVYAVDALTGTLKWQVKIDEHPSATITGSPVYHDGLVYVPVSSLEEAEANPHYDCCKFRGSVVALDAQSGRVVWKSFTIDKAARRVGKTATGTSLFAPSGAAIWSTPTLDPKRRLLYVGTGNNYTVPAGGYPDSIIAFDMKSGARRWVWRALKRDAWNVGCMIGNKDCPQSPGPDWDIGSGALLFHGADGRDRILVGLKNGVALSLDADTHRLLWETKVGRGGSEGGVQFGMAADHDQLYVPIADPADPRKTARADLNRPPRPGLYAIQVNSGHLAWSRAAENICAGRTDCDPGINASIVSIPGVVFAGHLDGRVQAYAAQSGEVLWSYDTTAPVSTLNGFQAHGGSIGGPGPVVHNGILYVNSGYGLFFHMPGNLLLAFSVDGL